MTPEERFELFGDFDVEASWSDPRDDSRYSVDDLLSLGFISSHDHRKLVEQSKPLADVSIDDSVGVMQAPGRPFEAEARAER